MTWCIYLTHPEVTIDPDVLVPDWGLSPLGRQRTQKALDLPWSHEICHIVSSTERKAIETARVIAETRVIPLEIVENLHENDRSATGFLPPPEFERTADRFFADPETSVRGWERAVDAQNRIIRGISGALEEIRQAQPVLFAGHGAVGTLLMCHLMGAPISRTHDQKRGGSWYLFEKNWLVSQAGTDLAWTEL